MTLASRLSGAPVRRSLLAALGLLVFSQGGLAHPDSPPPLGTQAAAAQGVTNTWCPVIPDEAVDPDIHVEYDGQRVYLCCQKCRKQFQADPGAYVANLSLLVAQEQEHDGSHAHEDEASGHEEHGDTAHGSEDHGADEHDHASHGDGASGAPKLISWVGRFHPMVVHFPIALLLLAGLAEFLSIRTRASHFAVAARFCLWAGASGALLSAMLGWANAVTATESYAGFLGRVLLFHRWVGTGTAAVSLLTLIAGERSMRTGVSGWKTLYRAGLFATVLLVSVAGHLGASLIYGWDYLAW